MYFGTEYICVSSFCHSLKSGLWANARNYFQQFIFKTWILECPSNAPSRVSWSAFAHHVQDTSLFPSYSCGMVLSVEVLYGTLTLCSQLLTHSERSADLKCRIVLFSLVQNQQEHTALKYKTKNVNALKVASRIPCI